MKYIKFTYVDSVTGVSIAVSPSRNGPVFPAIAGLEFMWARESAYPTNVPEFFGTCPDESSIEVDGYLGTFLYEDWVQMQADEMATRKPLTEETVTNNKIEMLWGAADAYTSKYISGVAIGILIIGVLQSLPKALAVSAWSSSVWAEYYRRKALVTPTSDDDLDFSAMGPMPHTVPELQVEIGM